jgi:hypothetical protein
MNFIILEKNFEVSIRVFKVKLRFVKQGGIFFSHLRHFFHDELG